MELVALDLDRRLVADLLPRRLPEERGRRLVEAGRPAPASRRACRAAPARACRRGVRSRPPARRDLGGFLRRVQPDADFLQVRFAATPTVRPAAPATRRAGAGFPSPGAASPGPARPTATAGDGSWSDTSWARIRSLLWLVTSTSHGRTAPPSVTIQFGICRKSACHTSSSCGRCLFSHFLTEASGPLAPESQAFSFPTRRWPAARRRPPAWTSSRP